MPHTPPPHTDPPSASTIRPWTWDVAVDPAPAEDVTGFSVRHQVSGRTHPVPAWVIAGRNARLTPLQAAETYAWYLSFVDPRGEMELIDVVTEMSIRSATQIHTLMEGGE